MQNSEITESNDLGRKHSLLSAIMYIDYYKEELRRRVKAKADKTSTIYYLPFLCNCTTS